MINIVLFGDPLSGKTTLLRSFARQRGATVESRSEGEHPTAPVILFVRLSIEGMEVELATIPGVPWDPGDWEPLLQRAQGLIVTFDLTQRRVSGMKGTRELIDSFSSGRPHVAVLTKAELYGRGRNPFRNIEEAIDEYDLHQWNLFVSSKDQPSVQAFDSLLLESCSEGLTEIH